MIGILATIKIKEGTNADFEAIAKQLVEKVNAEEEGALYYDLYKQDDTTYLFFEKYVDEAALKVHQGTEHYKSLGGQLGAFMAGRPEIKVLQLV